MLQNKEKQNIPKEWIYKSIGEFCEVINGSTPKSQVAKYWNGEIVWATPNDVRDSNIFISDSERKITREGLKSIGDRSVPENSIVISTRAPIGYVGVTKQQTAFNQGCKGIMSNSSHPVFLYYSMLNDGQKLKKMGAGSTFPELSAGDLKKHSLLLPPLKEQQKIVEVLGAVDEEIEKTKEVIKATEKLKKGLMQQLFTRGIGHTKFKQTELGEIPESWEVIKIQELIDGKIILENQDGNHGGDHPKSKEYVDEGIPFISAADVRHGRVDLEGCHFLPRERTDKLRIGFAKEGDVLLTHKGSVGNVAVVPKTKYTYLMLTPQVTYFRTDSKRIANTYLAYLFESPGFQRSLKAAARQSTRDFLSITNQRQLKIAFTSVVSEQKEIAEILSAVDKKISVNKKLLTKQTELKKGLMQDLLSGVKRVKV